MKRRYLKRKDFRLFKLKHMEDIQKIGKDFKCRGEDMLELFAEKIISSGIKVKTLF